jgi:PAS domain S-box-containing protein
MEENIDKLKESEEKYRSLVENMFDSVCIIDSNARLLFANKAAEKLTGYKLKEMENKSIFKILPKKHLSAYLKMISKSMLDKKVHYFETEIINKSGKIIHVDTEGSMIKFKGKKAIQIVTRDITERKKAGEEIKSAQEKWSSLVQNTNDVIMIVDNKGKIQYINKTIPPYTPKETVGKSVYEYVPREQQDIMRNSLRKVFKTGNPDSYEISSNIPKIGTVWFATKVVPIKHDGRIDNVIMISTDTTKQKNVEEEIKTEKTRLESYIEGMSDGVVILTLKGGVINVNKAYSRMFGREKSEVIGKSVFSVGDLPKKEFLGAISMLKGILQKGSVENRELTLLNKEKKEVPILFSATLIKDRRGKLESIFTTFKDITERKKAEEEVATAWKYAENLIANMPSSVLVFDDKLKCTSANWTYHQTFKKNIKHIESEDITHTLPSGMITKYNLDKKVVEVMKTGKTIELPKCQYNSEIYNVKIVKIAKKAEEEERFVMVIIDDVTEKVKAEEEIKKARDELVDKVAELERFSKVAVGRELKMVELKKRIVELERHLGKG